MRRGLLLTLLAMGLASPAGAAAQPANDDLSDAREVTPPTRVTGTLVDASFEFSEPPSACGPTEWSVWYEFRTPADRRAVILFDAEGDDLDAVVDVYRRVRSRLVPVDCDASDTDGRATLDLERLARGARYVIRVATAAGSAQGAFALQLLIPRPAARPPGRRLPPRGVTNSVTRLLNPSDAWSATLRAGTTYRVNLHNRGERCVSVMVYPPGTRSFVDGFPVRTLRCGGYWLFTPGPGEGGRYSFFVQAARRERRAQPYHLAVATAGPDDTTPGVSIGNYGRRRGSVHASGIDVVDLYRFDVVRRSALTLRLRARSGVQLILLSDTGRRIESETTLIRRNVRRGRYFVAVRSDTPRRRRYMLSRISRTITRARIRVNGLRRATIRPGSIARIGVSVAPAVSGMARIDVERFDPLAGWQFVRRAHVPVVGGKGVMPFDPPSVGRYRVRALFLRTRTAAASSTRRPRYARLLVAARLED